MKAEINDTIVTGSRAEYLQLLKRQKVAPARRAKEAAYLTLWRYRKQLVLAFNWVTCALTVAVTTFCFATAALPKAMAVILAAVVGSLAIRDA